MDDHIVLSIIIPVYNVEKYLAECLESVFSQDLTGCEVICVNDGSTDHSGDMLNKCEENYQNLVIINKENGGQASARNLGLIKSKGKYIYFLDSDDFLYNAAIRNIKSMINQYKADLFAFNALVDGKVLYQNNLSVLENKFYTGKNFVEKSFEITGTVATPVWIYVYRKDFLLNNKLLQKEQLYHEDELYTMLVLFYAKKVIVKDTPLIYYRWKREGAITTMFNEKFVKDRIRIAQELLSFYEKNNFYGESFLRKNCELLLLTINMLYKNNDFRFLKKSLYSEIYYLLDKCAVTGFEKKCLKLYKLSPLLMIKYYNNSTNRFTRKLINRLL